jgi:polyferredoxin
MLKLRYVRWGVQFGAFYLTFPLLLPVFYCPYAVPWIMCSVCPLYWCPLKFMREKAVAFIVSLTVVSGRGFCGWVCPYGSLQDLFNKVSRRLSGSGDFPLKNKLNLKYASLAATLLVIAHLKGWIHLPLVDYFLPTTPAWVPLTLAIFLLAASFTSRLWCRILCSLGAAMSPFNRASLLSLKLNDSKCVDCSRCRENCVAASDGKHVDTSSADCIVCGECVVDCPKDAFNYGLRYGKK